MRSKHTLYWFFILAFFNVDFIQAQDEKKGAKQEKQERRIGIARIQILASAAKGTPIADIANMPPCFGEKSDFIVYKKKGRNQIPPTTGDTIREITSDSIAVYLKKDLYSMSGYGDAGNTKRGKRNMIHDLPTDDPQKLAVDSTFDESIDIMCFWTFAETVDKKSFIPSVSIKMDIYDRTGQVASTKSVNLPVAEIKSSHFREAYDVNYDFAAGIPVSELAQGGVLGNVIADVYLQALNKLLAKKI
jgi:hypothetical protein